MNLRAGIIHGIEKIDIMESGSHGELLLSWAIMKRSIDFQKNNFAALSVGNGRERPIPSLLPCEMNFLKVYMSPVPFAELLECNNIWDKIRMFWLRVFLPKAIISTQYSVPMNSIKIYFCYPRRFVDVLRWHGHTLKKHQQNDASLKFLAVRTKKIADWLALQNT